MNSVEDMTGVKDMKNGVRKKGEHHSTTAGK
jgi:hypothetical protein